MTIETKDLLAINHEPGKFEGEPLLTELLYDRSEWASETLGESETFGHYMLFEDLDGAELGGAIGETKAAIVCTDSQGFVYGLFYASNNEARDYWARLEAEYSDETEEND